MEVYQQKSEIQFSPSHICNEPPIWFQVPLSFFFLTWQNMITCAWGTDSGHSGW